MGYWTYHKTKKGSYCCGPWCALGLLALPMMPVLDGFFLIKDKMDDKEATSYVETVSSDVSAKTLGDGDSVI